MGMTSSAPGRLGPHVRAGVTLAACLAVSAAQAAQDPGLVLSLDFETLAGRTFGDASGQGNDGEVIAGTRVKGVSGMGLDVSAAGASLICEDSPSLNLTGPLTLQAWVAPRSQDTGSFGTVIRKEGAYALRFDGPRLGLLFWCGGGIERLESPPLALKPGAWVHVAGTYDGERARLYVDGAEVAVSAAALPGEIDRSGAPCCIGSCQGQYAFGGAIDEVRIFARALTAAEIGARHQEGLRTLREQAAVPARTETIGTVAKPFRKPPREVRAVVPGFLWLDAEDFADYGGWVLDTQFVHLMGSAMLLAAGVGRPVADAQTAIEVPQAGTYRVWVRSRNWVPAYAPGQFTVRLDGKALPTILGRAESDAWVWELAGERELDAGGHALALHDMTGYYGRCDAIVLTLDRDYVPPAEREAVCQERARLCGFSLEPADGGDFDVIVVGGGPAGCPAALAAARLGARTALIHNRPVLGGNASDECGVAMNGAASAHPNARETGIAEEVGRVRARYGYQRYSEPFRILAEQETNLRVFLNRHVFAADLTDSRQIAAVRAVDTLTGQTATYRARLFVDCTGDGWLGYFAKAEYRLGREARSEFNEDLAPEKADALTMSGCLMGNALGFRARDTGRPVPFARPAWAREITRLEGPGRSLRSLSGGEWWLEHPNEVDDLWQAEFARDELIKIAFSYWDYVRNRSELRDKAATYALEHIPIMDAKRESRRLVGDYILTQNDCQSGRVFPDRIAYGGWPLDVHHPEGIFSGAKGSFYCNAHVPIYTIPFRCLYSKNIDNLLFAGRCASVTHIALGSIRVESTLATLGQAAGTAAALCVRRSITPRTLGTEHIAELQQVLLRHDQTIPGLRNEDPADLARRAKAVTASSTATFVEMTSAVLSPDTTHALDHDRGMLVPASAWERLNSVSLYLGNSGAAPVPLRLHVRTASAADDTTATTDAAAVEAMVPPGKESWVSFALGVPVSSPYLWLWVPRTEGIRWRRLNAAPEGCARLYGSASNSAWTRRPGEAYAIRTDPPLRVAAEFAPGNAIDGFARMTEGKTSLWASDPRQPLPQWLSLEFGERVALNTVLLTFDTNLSPRLPGPGNARETVRDYTVSVRQADAWKEVATVRGNFQRRSTARFETVQAEAVRVTVLATHGDPSARIFEVRLYSE